MLYVIKNQYLLVYYTILEQIPPQAIKTKICLSSYKVSLQVIFKISKIRVASQALRKIYTTFKNYATVFISF